MDNPEASRLRQNNHQVSAVASVTLAEPVSVAAPDTRKRGRLARVAAATFGIRAERIGSQSMNEGGENVQATTVNEGNPRPCVFKGCLGTMSYTISAHEPGTRAIARMSDGTRKTVGTERPGWICDRNPDHMQTEGLSGSEVVRSRM